MSTIKTHVQIIEAPVSTTGRFSITTGWSGKARVEIYFAPDNNVPLGYLTSNIPDISGPLTVYTTGGDPFVYDNVNWIDGQEIKLAWFNPVSNDDDLGTGVIQLFFKITRK